VITARKANNAILSAVLASGIGLVLGSTLASAAPITPGDLVVYQVGTGSAALTSASTAAFVDEYTTAGASVQQIALPTAASGTNNPLTNSGTATSEGELTVSPNGQYVTVAGYDAAPGVTGIASTSATTNPRVVGIIPVSTGAVDTSTTLGSTAFSGNNPRSAVTTNGTSIWVGGAGGTEATEGGVWYTTDGSNTSSALVFGNQRQVNVYNGQLYISSASATAPAVIGISAVGTGLPTSGPQTTTVIPGVDTSSTGTPYAYVFESLGGSVNPDTIYVADTTVGIEKYSLESGTWTETGSIALAGVTGIAALDTASGVDLFATTPSAIYSYDDTTGFEGTITGSATSIVSAATNTAFRGVGVIPTVPEPASLSLVGVSALALLARRRHGQRQA
jgi:hypothetical protein